MRYQREPGWCAVASIQNALRSLGQRVGQDTIAKHIPDCDDGADVQDAIRAIGLSGYTPIPFVASHKRDARAWLLGLEWPAILCVDRWEHWVCVAGKPPGPWPRVYVFDSAREPWNVCENGVHSLLAKTLLKRWRAARADRSRFDGAYYAIEIRSTVRNLTTNQ